ncbi:sarcosine oxidase subunit beta family protein [Paraburkholderia phytofirmans]
MSYSLFSLIRNTLTGHKNWKPTWRDASPRKSYDIVIIGGGGHGLATAYYLAKRFGLKSVAVIERGWIGSGNAGRNTTIIRSNYILPGNEHFYEYSLKLWERFEQEIGYNAMVSQRGAIYLYHSDAERDAFARRGNAMRLAGADSEILTPAQLRQIAPYLEFEDVRFPIQGALLQRRAGTARHDAVVWGYAHAASELGVDIIQNCEVTALMKDGNRVVGVETTRGDILAGRVGSAVAGSSSRVAAMAGLRLPIETHVLQAFVSEGIKPLLPGVMVFGAGHFYINQSDKGGLVFGGSIDGYNSYAQRGSLSVIENVAASALAIMPCLARMRILRGWGGLMDMSMDGSPIIDATPVDNFFLNGGWCYGGFKATPASGWCFSHLLATGRSEPIAAAYRLDRFRTGRTVDERGAGPYPQMH